MSERLGKWILEGTFMYMLQESFSSTSGRRYEENRHWVTVNSHRDVPPEEVKEIVAMFASAPTLSSKLAKVERERDHKADQYSKMVRDHIEDLSSIARLKGKLGRVEAELADTYKAFDDVTGRLATERAEAAMLRSVMFEVASEMERGEYDRRDCYLRLLAAGHAPSVPDAADADVAAGIEEDRVESRKSRGLVRHDVPTIDNMTVPDPPYWGDASDKDPER